MDRNPYEPPSTAALVRPVSDRASAAIPRSLQLAILPALAIALFFAHGWIAAEFSELPSLFQTRPTKLAALFAGSVLAAAAVSLIFAYPLVVTYGGHSFLAAVFISVPTVCYRASFISSTSGKFFVALTLVMELVALAVLAGST